MPAGHQAGTLCIASSIGASSDTFVSVSAGWTNIGIPSTFGPWKIASFYRYCTASGETGPTFTWTAVSVHISTMAGWNGCALTGLQVAQMGDTSSGSPSTGSFASGVANSNMLLAGLHNGLSTAIAIAGTDPTSYTVNSHINSSGATYRGVAATGASVSGTTGLITPTMTGGTPTGWFFGVIAVPDLVIPTRYPARAYR